MEANYTVDGMTCGGCVRSVETVVAKAAPGAEIEVDLGAGRLKVVGEHDPAAVVTAVENAGFDCVLAA